MKKVVVLGGEGNGLVIASTIERCKMAIVKGFLNDVNPIGTQIGITGTIPVIARTEEVSKMLEEDDDLYVISGYGGMTDPQATLKRLHSLRIPRERFFNAIDDTAVFPVDYCVLGHGIFMGPLVQLSAAATIGDHCSLFGNSFIGHDTVVGEFCHIATNAVVGARVQIGTGVHVGINASVREKIRIGDNSVVGMGAVVVKDVPPNAIVAGNPAKIIKMRGE
jgi:acetyltransferase EpsM